MLAGLGCWGCRASYRLASRPFFPSALPSAETAVTDSLYLDIPEVNQQAKMGLRREIKHDGGGVTCTINNRLFALLALYDALDSWPEWSYVIEILLATGSK